MLRLKQIRLDKGLSVQKLADQCGIHRRTLEDIEKRGDCMLSTAAKLSKALEVTLNDLWNEEAGE